MRIILTENVPNLGSLGDEVQVKDGYARNYLLPRGMAIPAEGRDARAIQHRRTWLEKQREEAIKSAQSEAERVAGLQPVLKVRAGSGGRLFGSVTNRDLQAALAELGVEVDRRAIQLYAQVKSLGAYSASVRLHTDVKVDVEFRVEPIEQPAAQAEGQGEEAAAGGAEGAEAAEDAEGAEAAEATPAPEEAEGEAQVAEGAAGEAAGEEEAPEAEGAGEAAGSERPPEG